MRWSSGKRAHRANKTIVAAGSIASITALLILTFSLEWHVPNNRVTALIFPRESIERPVIPLKEWYPSHLRHTNRWIPGEDRFDFVTQHQPADRLAVANDLLRRDRNHALMASSEGEPFVTLSTRQTADSGVLSFQRVVMLLPGEQILWPEANQVSAPLRVQCLGSTADRLDIPAHVMVARENISEPVPISPRGDLAELNVQDATGVLWPENAPGILVILGWKEPTEKPKGEGVVFVTIPQVDGGLSSLPNTNAALVQLYGKDSVLTLDSVWPASDLPRDSLAGVLSGRLPADLGLFLNSPGAQTSLTRLARPHLEDLFSAKGIHPIRVSLVSPQECSLSPCLLEEQAGGILGLSRYDMNIVVSRNEEFRSIATRLFSQVFSMEGVFLHLNVLQEPNNLKLTWQSAIQAGKGFPLWTLAPWIGGDTLKTRKKQEFAAQIDDTLTSLIRATGKEKSSIRFVFLIHDTATPGKGVPEQRVVPGQVILAPAPAIPADSSNEVISAYGAARWVLGSTRAGAGETHGSARFQTRSQDTLIFPDGFLTFKGTNQTNGQAVITDIPLQDIPEALSLATRVRSESPLRALRVSFPAEREAFAQLSFSDRPLLCAANTGSQLKAGSITTSTEHQYEVNLRVQPLTPAQNSQELICLVRIESRNRRWEIKLASGNQFFRLSDIILGEFGIQASTVSPESSHLILSDDDVRDILLSHRVPLRTEANAKHVQIWLEHMATLSSPQSGFGPFVELLDAPAYPSEARSSPDSRDRL